MIFYYFSGFLAGMLGEPKRRIWDLGAVSFFEVFSVLGEILWLTLGVFTHSLFFESPSSILLVIGQGPAAGFFVPVGLFLSR